MMARKAMQKRRLPDFLKYVVCRSTCRRLAGCCCAIILFPLLTVSTSVSACELIIDSAALRFSGSGRYAVFNGATTGELTIALRRSDFARSAVSGDIAEDGSAAAVEESGSTLSAVTDACYGSLRVMPAKVSNRSGGINVFLLNSGRHLRNGLDMPVRDIPAGEVLRIAIDVVVPAGQYVASGEEEIEFDIYLGSSDSSVSEALAQTYRAGFREQTVVYDILEVDSVYRLSIVGENARRMTVDLGELGNQVTRKTPLAIHVVANNAYSLQFHSENRGKLVSHSGASVHSIDYRLYADRASINLKKDAASINPLPERSTSSRGVTLPLHFEVDSGYRKHAGIYRDVLRIEVMPAL